MSFARNFKCSLVLATALGVGMAPRLRSPIRMGVAEATGAADTAAGTSTEAAHHEVHHESGHHEAEHHPYHPSENHLAGHDEHHGEHHDDHHDDHHWNHHHHDWHYAGWGPGFWGGLGAGYLGGWATSGWGGGNTYVDNSNSGNTTDNPTPVADNSDNNSASDSSEDNQVSQSVANASEKLPVDVWPELGISTYSGEYGNSRGLVVVRVMPQSAADKAGLVPGDVILKFNGQSTPDDETLESLLDSARGNFNLLVWDARTGRKSDLAGQLEPEEQGAKDAG